MPGKEIRGRSSIATYPNSTKAYKKGGDSEKKKQGYIDKKDESIGERLGKGKATKEDPKKAAKERDLSFGKWGSRGKDWKKKA